MHRCSFRSVVHAAATTLLLGGIVVTLSGTSGCSAGGETGAGSPRQLSEADFIASGDRDVSGEVPPGAGRTESPQAPHGDGGAERRFTLGGSTLPDDLQPPEPSAAAARSVADGARPARRPLAPGDRVIVESMVGQINGRPFFADTFFLPIADQIAALGRRLPLRDFLDAARMIIANHLHGEVLNALFVAEAQALLTAEEQVGLRAWLASTREVVTARRGGGTVEAARRSIREEEGGLSLEQYVEEIRDAQLLRQLFERRIAPRVIVSQLDIERAYARRFEEFNPPARVSLDRIRLSAETQAELIEQVTRRLEAGESVAVVAAEIGAPAAGPWQDFEVPGGDLTRIDFPDQRIREAMHALDGPGSVTRPIRVGSAVWWLSVRSIEQREGQSVYDPHVQRQLAGEIRAARMSEEQQRFTDSLLREGIYDEMGGMVDRLLVIAVDRYGPQ